MTEAAYQAARPIMQRANYLRGLITKAKGNVAKWTRIEDVYRREGELTRANGTNKLVLKAIEQLKKVQKEFDDLKFPDNDLIGQPKQNTCQTCGDPIGKSDKFCSDICEMAGTNVNKTKRPKLPLKQINPYD